VVVATLILAGWALGENVEQLLLGWLYFPIRTIPKMTVDWPSAVVGIVSLLMFVFGLHRTVCWFVNRSEQTDVVGKRWSWRGTLTATFAMVILFVSGTALVGAFHQVAWLLSGRADRGATAEVAEFSGLLTQVRDSARRSESINNLRQFSLGFHNFHDVAGAFPPGGTISRDGELLHGWAIPIGPYVSYMPPEDLDMNQSWKTGGNAKTFKCQLSCFLNPSLEGSVFDEDGFGLCHFAGNVHVMPIRIIQSEDQATQSWSALTKGIAIDQITDGTANTLLLGTVGQNCKPWGHPANVRDPALGINRSPDGFGGPPSWRGGHFAMCDGSVRFISEDIDPGILEAMGTIAGGEVIPEDL